MKYLAVTFFTSSHDLIHIVSILNSVSMKIKHVILKKCLQPPNAISHENSNA